MFQKKVVQKIETHILCSIYFFKNHPAYVMWKNDVERGRPRQLGAWTWLAGKL